MTDRGHCKLLYEEGEDLHEYENFYDFSASYTEAEQNGIVRRATSEATAAAAGACTYERNGTDKLDGEMISDETDDDDDTDGDDHVEVSKTLSVTDLGELVLLDGKTVGNRQWRRYYRQRLRAPDEREVVVAQHRAMRLRLGAMYDEEVRGGGVFFAGEKWRLLRIFGTILTSFLTLNMLHLAYSTLSMRVGYIIIGCSIYSSFQKGMSRGLAIIYDDAANDVVFASRYARYQNLK